MFRKDQVIEAIREINATASREWLNLFDLNSLRQYLDHLYFSLEPRTSKSVWIRPNDSPAIITRKPLD